MSQLKEVTMMRKSPKVNVVTPVTIGTKCALRGPDLTKFVMGLSLVDGASWSAAVSVACPSVTIHLRGGITMARLAIHLPTCCDENLILPGERHGVVLVEFQARGCGPCLRQRPRLGISGGLTLYILDLQPV